MNRNQKLLIIMATMIMAGVAIVLAAENEKNITEQAECDLEVKKQLEELGLVNIITKSGNFFVYMDLDNDRFHNVTIESNIFDRNGRKYRRIRADGIFTYQNKPGQEILLDLLQQNASTEDGAWAVKYTHKHYYVAYFQTVIEADASKEYLVFKLAKIAKIADEKEAEHMAGLNKL